jgi:hypothetical protein
MTPKEVGGRLLDQWHQQVWAVRRAVPVPTRPHRSTGDAGRGTAQVAPDWSGSLPANRRQEILDAADGLLIGRWEVLGVERGDLLDPDWSLDPTSGRRFPADRCSFKIDYRSGDEGGKVKQVWELSRHHHLTVLAAAWRLTGDEEYAAMVSRQLRSWWRHNPVVSGVNWASGIELGIRLVSWVWVRRLLEGWHGAAALFEDNEDAVRQVHAHQRYLATFRSRGSSANNHVIAEAAGQLVASCAFPWFGASARWRVQAQALLEAELSANTFASGIDREQAFEYHGLVAELGIVAGVEAELAGFPLAPDTWRLLCRMLDVLAAVVDQRGRPPRQGDGDDGRALLLGSPASDRWGSLLAVGDAVFGRLPWWPATSPDAASLALGPLLGRRMDGGARPEVRPSSFADAGLALLRSRGDDEIWCRCDGGPHGFLSIAAHAHADALSVEVRHRGVDVLADPGTYCYQGEPRWRSYFRSTIAHNTIELAGRDQSASKGPFLWVRHARSEVLESPVAGSGLQRWSASHDGYLDLPEAARHQRTVALDVEGHSLEIVDRLASAGECPLRMGFHLGPAIRATLEGPRAELEWEDPDGALARATLELPQCLDWSAYRGSTEPILGWYSPGFGRKVPSTSLVGRGELAGATTLTTRLRFSGRSSDRAAAGSVAGLVSGDGARGPATVP